MMPAGHLVYLHSRSGLPFLDAVFTLDKRLTFEIPGWDLYDRAPVGTEFTTGEWDLS